MRFSFPDELSPPSVEQRHRFYEEEFNVQRVRELAPRWSHPVFAIDIGTESTLYKRRFKEYKNKMIFVREYDDLEHLQKKLAYYAPEDLYYETKTYDTNPQHNNAKWQQPSGQQLVFDLDPELVDCRSCELTRRHMENETVASYTFCEECFVKVAEATADLRRFLTKHFDRLQTYFSGRGFHIHVKDEEGFSMSKEQREELASRLEERFPIDTKITAGEKGLMRLPGSLHGLTGRKVVKVSLDDLEEESLQILYEKSVPEVLQ